MNPILAADIVLLVHGLFIVFVMFGGLLALWRPWLAWLHLPALAWGAAVISMGWVCPLTPLENELRNLAGHSSYDGGFIQHYLWPLIYPPGLTRTLQIGLATALALGNSAVYLAVWKRQGIRSTKNSNGKTPR